MILVRSALFNAWFIGVTVLFCLGGLPVRWRARRAGRRVVIAYAKIWARTVLAGLRPLAGIGWRLDGPIPVGAALLAAQHQSAFETLLWTVLLPDFTFVLKQELVRIPLFGPLLRAGGMIAIDRAAGAAALRTLLREGTAAARAGRQIVIFPEGTRMAPGAAAALHPGIAALAQHTGLAVTPVVTDSGRYWGRRAFRKQPGTIRVAVLGTLPAGLPRQALLDRLAHLFASGPPPCPAARVDNYGDR
jgi:1-acyl-sn-glycerol-3-phosphate acyltransferase